MVENSTCIKSSEDDDKKLASVLYKKKPLEHAALDANELLNMNNKTYASKPILLKIFKKKDLGSFATTVGRLPIAKYNGIDVSAKKKITTLAITALGKPAIKHLEDNIEIGGFYQFESYQVNNFRGYPGIEVNTSTVINSFEKLGYSIPEIQDDSSMTVKAQILGFDNVDIYKICSLSKTR